MSYNVQPLRTQQEINNFLFCLRRNKNAKHNAFLFLIVINSGLHISDIIKLKKKTDFLNKSANRGTKNRENTHFVLKQPAGLDSRLCKRPRTRELFVSQY